MKEMPSRSNLLIPLLVFLFVSALFFYPALASSQIAKFVFTTEPQTINPGELSGAMTIQAQDVNGEKTNTTETIDLEFSSTSSTGEFLNASGNPVSTVMAKNTANRTFYYRDSTTGIYTLKVKAVGRDSGETWEVFQNITVGATSSTTSSSSGSEAAPAPNAGWVEEEEKKFTAVINSAPSGIAGADFVFEGRLNGENGKEVQAERYFWSFGDGAWKDGKKVAHAFVFPGKYQVSFSAKITGRSISAYREIDIFENKLAVIDAKGGEHSWIKLSNGASQRLNLAGWILRESGQDFYFPEETYLLPKAFLTIAEEVSGLKLGPGGEIQLLYPNGSLFQSFSYPGSKSLAAAAPVFSPEPKIQTENVATGTPPEVSASAETQPALLASFFSNPAMNWGLGALGIGLLAALGFVASKRIS